MQATSSADRPKEFRWIMSWQLVDEHARPVGSRLGGDSRPNLMIKRSAGPHGEAAMALGTYGPSRELDIGRCFNEAIEGYKKNFLPLFLAAILFDVLSVLTLFVLSGPLAGGICLMTLKA